MQKITEEAVHDLLAVSETPKVTIYIPLEVTASPPHITENQIRFKNLIHVAVDQLQSNGDTSSLASELTAVLNQHFDNLDFWKNQTRGLLICATAGNMHMLQLPVDTEEYVSIDDSFHLAPILALLGEAREYYVLAIAQQHPKLFKGDMYGLYDSGITIPETMRSALGIDEPNQPSENQGSATGSSMNTGWFNGRGGAKDPRDTDRLRYFHLIDKIVLEKADRSLPLILAGIDAEIAEYRELSKYLQILRGSISGNQSDNHLSDIFCKAHTIVRHELVTPERHAAREEYDRVSGTHPDRIAGDTRSIIAAAEQGRVDKLLAMMGRSTTDTVQDSVESVFRITFPEGEKSKTLNRLAMTVWQMRGKVMSLLPSEMPSGAPMVARLRY